MVQLSAPWVEPGPARTVIEAQPMLAALLPTVEACHGALYKTQVIKNPTATAEALLAEGATCDERHDGAIRGTFALLGALSDLTASTAYAELRDFLLPRGMMHTRLRYDEEAGEAGLLAARLAADPAKKKALKEISVGPKTLLSVVEGWIADAKRLGEIEREKAALATTDSGPTPSEVRDLRNRWARAVRSLEAVAELADLDEATTELLFGRLYAVAKANRPRKGTAPVDGADEGDA